MQKYYFILLCISVSLFCCFKFFKNINVELSVTRYIGNEKINVRITIALQQVSDMNDRLDNLRKTLLMISEATNETVVDKTPIVYVDERNENFFEVVKEFPCVFFITYPLKSDKKIQNTSTNSSAANVSSGELFSFENLLSHKYYRLTGDNSICYLIQTNRAIHAAGYRFNYTCNNDTKLAVEPTPLEPLRFNMIIPTNVTEVVPDYFFVFPDKLQVMRVLTNSLISNLGEQFCDRLHVRSFDCLKGPGNRPSIKDQLATQYHEEVFVITQYWGWAFFHRLIKDLPRLALFVDFLRKHPTIKILTADNSSHTRDALEVMGISKRRLIVGWVRAKIAYIPRPTQCGSPFVLELQFLNHHYRKYIAEQLMPSMRNKLILIRRSGRRYLTQHGLMEHYLRAIAKENGLEYVVFYDNPPPSFNDTMSLFGSASVIVAPHGAGLSNMIYSKPGTLIIEGICNHPHTNLCYQVTAYGLGMRYHALTSRGGCESHVDVFATDTDTVLRDYLKYIPIKELTT